jgi:hypothetical protein
MGVSPVLCHSEKRAVCATRNLLLDGLWEGHGILYQGMALAMPE